MSTIKPGGILTLLFDHYSKCQYRTYCLLLFYLLSFVELTASEDVISIPQCKQVVSENKTN